ncbi:GNAT family N-acetyltransferase [Planococcus maritimus]|nr:GNAT family N-acetyltransferase [Planococcus sp. SK3692]MDE4086755.1 GNAT family N-acetyltransferase [Planococcus maritimus]
MKFKEQAMTEESARDILAWSYPYPYDFYNGEVSDESLQELMDGSYRVVLEHGKLFGFYCTGKGAQVPAGHESNAYPAGPVDIGLGMKPEKTGAGRGAAFVGFLLGEINKRHPGQALRLTVAQFNARAIRLYERAGFVKAGEFKNDYATFQVMLKSK